MKKVFTKVFNVFLAVIVILAAISVASSVQMKITKDHVPGIGPCRYMTVLSGSMSPVFNPYDVIVDKKVDVDQLQKGDVITFRKDNSLVTHRVVEANREAGQIKFKTKGDANNVEDSELVDGSQVVGKYIFRIPLLGYVMAKLRGALGVVLLWALCIYIFAGGVISAIKQKKLDEDEDEDGSNDYNPTIRMHVDETSGFITVSELNAHNVEEGNDSEELSHACIRYPDEK